MVTWGSNTTHVFGATAPTPGGTTGFGSPAPASGGLFGSPSAPAPSGGLFGSSPAPAPSGGLFGAPAPSPGGSLFGTPSQAPSSGYGFSSSPAPAAYGGYGTPAPAPGTSLFGAPAPNAYGAPSSLYGGTPAAGQQQQQQQIPAQAALQAHMDASARQEAERVRSALESLHMAYTGNTSSTSKESKFVTIVYNDMSPQERQLQWVHGMATEGQIMSPPKPLQVPDAQWKKAVVSNPDPLNYMPVALVGALALQGRLSWQQGRAKELASNATTLHQSHDMLKDRCARVKQEVEQYQRRHAALRKRLLDVMRRVELARCMNQPIQPDELKAVGRLRGLSQTMEGARGSFLQLQDRARAQPTARQPQVTAMPDKEKLLPVLKEHRAAIEKVTTTAKRDMRDIGLIHQRVIAKIPAPPVRS
jgi:hypothetical protein